MEFVDQYLKEHPDLKRVIEAEKEDQNVLLWALKKRYITLASAPNGELCYSDEDLAKAKMWREKDET